MVFFEPYKGRRLAPGQRVKVYRNLHKKGVVYSVMDAQSGLVLGHSEAMVLSAVAFEVNAAGRERVRRTGKKQVHAFVTGYWCGPYYAGDWDLFTGMCDRAVTYNPYKYETFVRRDGESPVTEASLAVVGPQGVGACETAPTA